MQAHGLSLVGKDYGLAINYLRTHLCHREVRRCRWLVVLPDEVVYSGRCMIIGTCIHLAGLAIYLPFQLSGELGRGDP